MEIIPAIIGQNWSEVKEKIKRVEGLVNWVQVDIADGLFAPNITWQTAEDLKEVNGKTKIEAHLMIESPEEVLIHWLEVADRILIHYESTDHLAVILDSFSNRHVEPGVVLGLETPITKVLPYLDQVKVVQLMSIANIGHHGEPFADEVLEKITALRKASPSVIINVDGGITLETGKKCLAAGANNLVVGSAIWQSKNISESIREFQKLIS